MEWLNIHSSTLDSPEMIGAEPVDRATWLFLARYCTGQENGGRIAACHDWGDRRWQQSVRVTLEEVRRESELWEWDGDDLCLRFYPIEKEAEIRAKRTAGKLTVAKRWAKQSCSANSSAIRSADTEGKGREGKGMEGNTIHTSVCTDESVLHLEVVDAETPTPKTRKHDATPYQAILDMWATACPALPQPQFPTEARKRNLRSFYVRVGERAQEPQEWLQWLFQQVAASDFLSGRATKWRADLWWVIKPENLAKIVDGNYNNR
jgi:hypothetical protein